MTEISATLVKELRERTGVGMGKCKEALVEARGDIELAIANLRKAGIASAVKKESRETNEGTVVTAENATHLVMVEVNAETDFVVKNEKFQAFAKDVAETILNHKIENLDTLLQHKYAKDPKLSMDELRALTMQSLGENIQIKRMLLIQKKPEQSWAFYSHAGGKLVTAVEIDGSSSVQDLAKDMAMHVAAESPDYVSEDAIPAHVIEHEKEIARAQIKNKPDAIVDKIMAGKLKDFYAQVCLIHQPFVKDPKMTIAQLLEEHGKRIGKKLTLKQFLRWRVG
jgi:elongation factor Ts